MTEKIIKETVYKCVAIIYMIVLSIFTSKYILNVYEVELWDNEKVAMRAFIVMGMLVSLTYFAIKEKNILKLMFVYHYILIGTAVCIMLPVKFMPLVNIDNTII